MANEEQLEILRKGVEVWNLWRKENREAEIDLKKADLEKASLKEADLNRADLSYANLREANFHQAWLTGANLTGVDLLNASLYKSHLFRVSLLGAKLHNTKLIGADLSYADLSDADLSNADFTAAHLVGTNFTRVNFTGANLSNANLMEAILDDVNLNRVELNKADFTGSILNDAHLRGLNLSSVIGLRDVTHDGPSSLSTDTLVISKGLISEKFLKGCGLSDWEIEAAQLYNPNLNNEERNTILYKIYDLQASQAVQISPLFLSYSHADGKFVDKLEPRLNALGIRFWRDVHHATAGRLEKVIDRAMRLNPTVVLILSEKSVRSDWVEHEVRTARELEKDIGRDVLCPVALDDSWKSSRWPKRVMEQIMEYNILDFSEWEDDVKFEEMFRKLIDGLELFYK